jgi:hypothetical protein
MQQDCETANISSCGVLFHANRLLDIGSVVEYTLTLIPAADSRKAVLLHCIGNVVRHAGEAAVAATLERYEFVRSD